MKKLKQEYISVDVETSGPNPSNYALLSIGACTISEPRKEFYIELKPDKDGSVQEAMAISKLTLDDLQKNGTPAKDAMQKFSHWLGNVIPERSQPVFTAFNAPFDWMFVNDYFHRYLGHNPFGHKALDIKALYMGLRKTKWLETSYNIVNKDTGITVKLSHHALEDAIQQAKIFEILLEELGGK
jgi:ribonuclease T